MEVSYLKCQKKDWASYSRKVIIGLPDKVGERLQKRKDDGGVTLTLTWQYTTKEFPLLDCSPQHDGSTCVRLSWAVRTRHAHVALGDGVSDTGTSSVVRPVET